MSARLDPKVDDESRRAWPVEIQEIGYDVSHLDERVRIYKSSPEGATLQIRKLGALSRTAKKLRRLVATAHLNLEAIDWLVEKLQGIRRDIVDPLGCDAGPFLVTFHDGPDVRSGGEFGTAGDAWREVDLGREASAGTWLGQVWDLAPTRDGQPPRRVGREGGAS